MVYQRFGVTRFGDYAAQAQSAGIVQLGVIPGGESWIALQAKYRDASLSVDFSALVEILNEERLHGNPCPTRSVVSASLIKRAPNAIKQAGAKDFRRYCMLAENAGIIQIASGQTKGSEGLISLQPRWRVGASLSSAHISSA